MLYAGKVRWLKSHYGYAAARRWHRVRQHDAGSVADYVRRYAPGHSFLDIGGMWRTNGAHSMLAEEVGATSVTLVDLYQTEEFRAECRRRESAVRFVEGDAADPGTVAMAGRADVVWCFGVLYHHPNPHALAGALREMCLQTLVLETLTIPEIPGVPQAAVYLPYLDPGARRLWDTTGNGGARVQLAVSTDFDPDADFANNFWALSPSAVSALLRTTGFRVTSVAPSPKGVLRHVFVASVA